MGALRGGPSPAYPVHVDDRQRVEDRRRTATAEVDGVRGQFLAAMIDLEAHVDRAVVFFFAPDEPTFFIESILERLNFSLKTKILQKMLRSVELDKKYQTLLKEIDDLRIERNKFAHLAFEFVGNSYMFPGEDYELYRKERLDPGPRLDDIIHLSDLRAIAQRAREAEGKAFLLERELTKVHDPPQQYFFRKGWDPRSIFSGVSSPVDDGDPYP